MTFRQLLFKLPVRHSLSPNQRLRTIVTKLKATVMATSRAFSIKNSTRKYSRALFAWLSRTIHRGNGPPGTWIGNNSKADRVRTFPVLPRFESARTDPCVLLWRSLVKLKDQSLCRRFVCLAVIRVTASSLEL